ncbi:MAG: NAD(P)/FAD-dependent oxidoreductase [Roseobacter sp.]
MPSAPRIAIIGAGLTGLHLSRRLSATAHVKVFEKSRGFGGRMSTRRAEAFQFDHGAQYFTARGQVFQTFLKPFQDAGTVARWQPRLALLGAEDGPTPVWTAPRYVAQPGMNALAKEMANGQDVHRATRIASVQKVGTSWRLVSETRADCGLFDWVLFTAPAEQSALFMPESFQHAETLCTAQMLGCYSLMIGLDRAVDVGWDAAVVKGGAVAWMAMNHSKPGRSAAPSLLVQSSNTWANAHLEDPQQDVEALLCQEASVHMGLDVQTMPYRSLHRWRFASVAVPAHAPYLLDQDNGLAAAGDWCGAGKVEAAFDSAEALAHALLETL